jgi:hypothetical protein
MSPDARETGRRRQRKRPSGSSPAQAAQPVRPAEPTQRASTGGGAAPSHDHEPGNRGDRGERAGKQRGSDSREDRGWRELAGSSPSQVGVSGAMRARDVARPTPADYEAAERDLTIVRRDWQPPTEELPPPVRR